MMVNHNYASAIIFLAVSVVTTNGQQQQQSNSIVVDPCNGECENGSKCVVGDADFTSHTNINQESPLPIHGQTNIDGYHCECSHGWTGVKCDIPYSSCLPSEPENDTEQQSPLNDDNIKHSCYNGGECIPGLIDEFGNGKLFCDCTNAYDSDNNIQYVGKYCEHQAVNYCDDDGAVFCVNDGQCNEDYPLNGASPCICQGEYDGPHCEYKKKSVPDCNLQCLNGGYCVLGGGAQITRTTAGDTESHYSFKRCQCPTGFSGELCENDDNGTRSEIENQVEHEKQNQIVNIDIDVENFGYGENENVNFSNDDDDKCDDDNANLCLNGGACLKTYRKSKGDIQYNCDCSTANKNDDSVSYAGRYCQYEATSYCTKNVYLNELFFCVNNGVCKDNIYQGCDCPKGYTGFSCELRVEEETEDSDITLINVSSKPNKTSIVEQEDIRDNDYVVINNPLYDDPEYIICDLNCMNGGSCRKGTKKNYYKNNGDDDTLSEIIMNIRDLNTTNTENFDHCVCPIGYIGLQCEHKVETCGDKGEHYCLHGSKCIRNTNELGEEQHGCDCSVTDSNDTSTVFSGKSCEHKATDICTVPDRTIITAGGYDSEGSDSFVKPLSFCVNGGTCIKQVAADETHAGCDCPNGWEGIHCELKGAIFINEIQNTGEETNSSYYEVNEITNNDEHINHADEPSSPSSSSSSTITTNTQYYATNNAQTESKLGVLIEVFVIILIPIMILVLLIIWIMRRHRKKSILINSINSNRVAWGSNDTNDKCPRHDSSRHSSASKNNSANLTTSCTWDSWTDSAQEDLYFPNKTNSCETYSKAAFFSNAKVFDNDDGNSNSNSNNAPWIQDRTKRALCQQSYINDDSMVYMGPPVDEDGNELHAVELI